MPIIETNKTVNGRKISYEVCGDGYVIFLSNRPWVAQHEPYIPYPELGYEGSCLKQIDDITRVPEPGSSNLEERVAKLEQENRSYRIR